MNEKRMHDESFVDSVFDTKLTFSQMSLSFDYGRARRPDEGRTLEKSASLSLHDINLPLINFRYQILVWRTVSLETDLSLEKEDPGN